MDLEEILSYTLQGAYWLGAVAIIILIIMLTIKKILSWWVLLIPVLLVLAFGVGYVIELIKGHYE